MSLKVILKPKERLFINGGVIVNDEERGINLIVANNIPILREKDILTEASADTPCKKIYLTVQLMYMEKENLDDYHKKFRTLVAEVLKAAPSTTGLIQKITEQILNCEYYKALKHAHKLIQYEKELINASKKSA
ncbi:MAG: flagellar biosynthesis repressor FlbT [Nitrospiria bacterium]